AAARERAGRPIAERLRARGEPAFRALEAEVVESLLRSPCPRVVALGGGSLLERARRLRALDVVCLVTLEADVSTLALRSHTGARPLLDGTADRHARIGELLSARGPSYAEAHARVSTEARTLEEVVAEVMAVWGEPRVAV